MPLGNLWPAGKKDMKRRPPSGGTPTSEWAVEPAPGVHSSSPTPQTGFASPAAGGGGGGGTPGDPYGWNFKGPNAVSTPHGPSGAYGHWSGNLSSDNPQPYEWVGATPPWFTDPGYTSYMSRMNARTKNPDGPNADKVHNMMRPFTPGPGYRAVTDPRYTPPELPLNARNDTAGPAPWAPWTPR